MNDLYFLSPFVRITKTQNGFILKSLLNVGDGFFINDFSEISPKNSSLIGDVFISKSEKTFFIENSLKKLEKFFEKQKNSVGYIETTSVCPYKCQICPKSSTQQIRLKKTLDIKDLEKILFELSNNGVHDVTFHVFGDPFYDKNIYEKIQLANSFGIVPSFSTNLVSLLRVDMEKIYNLKIGNLTISIDSYNEKILSEIRGKISQNLIDKAINKIGVLADAASKTDCINNILLQQISLQNNTDEFESLIQMFKDFPKIKFVSKKYIHFPGVNSKLETKEIIYDEESTLIYRILGERMPFKCLKPWIKREIGVLSDGSFVPCCLTLNKDTELGTAKEQDLDTFFHSEKHRVFRKNIFFNNSSNLCNTCVKCTLSSSKADFFEDVGDMSLLKSYCINDWS